MRRSFLPRADLAARGLAAGLSLALLAGHMACAEAILGLWRTEPDGKGQVGDVRVAPCGEAYCGTIVRAENSAGEEIVTRNVGREVISGMRPAGSGAYDGRVFVPIFGQHFPATARVGEDRLVLEACNAVGMCRSRTWRRLE